MKRDMDIIRKIVLAIRDSEFSIRELDGVDFKTFGFHAQLVIEAGLVDGNVATSSNGRDAKAVLLHRLTWQRHDFADACQDDTVWNKAKAKLMGPSLSWTFDILRDVIAGVIKDGLKL